MSCMIECAQDWCLRGFEPQPLLYLDINLFTFMQVSFSKKLCLLLQILGNTGLKMEVEVPVD